MKTINFSLLLFVVTLTCSAQNNLLNQLSVPKQVYTAEFSEYASRYYIPSFITKDSAFYPGMAYLQPTIYSLHKFDIHSNALIASAVLYGDTVQVDSIIEILGEIIIDKNLIHCLYVKRIIEDTALLPQAKRFSWALYYKQLDTNLATTVTEKRIKLGSNQAQLIGLSLQSAMVINNHVLVGFLQADSSLPGSTVSQYMFLDFSGQVLKEDTLGQVVITSSTNWHRLAEFNPFPGNRCLVSGINLYPMASSNGAKMFYIADTAMNLIDTFDLKPSWVYNPPDVHGYFYRYPNLLVLPTGSIIGGAPYTHFPAGNTHTALFKCTAATRYSIDKLVTFKNIDPSDGQHESRPSIHNLTYNHVDNCIYYADATHSSLTCLYNENYVQVICADTNLNVKWKKYIKVANDACAHTHYTIRCDNRPGVLVGGSTYNTTDPQNATLYIPFIYRLDSAIVANIDNAANSPASDRILLAPNPVSNNVTVRDIESNLAEIQLLDFTGKTVFITQAKDKKAVTLNLSDLASGWYLLRVTTTDAEVYNKKILKN